MKPTKLFPAEHMVAVYHHVPDAGVTIEDLQERGYWTHVARMLRMGHRIEVLSPDGGWWAMLIVRAASSNEAVVQPLQYVELGEQVADTATDSPYKVMWRGPARKFSVVRKDDGEVIRDEFPVKEEAFKWMENHMRSMAA